MAKSVHGWAKIVFTLVENECSRLAKIGVHVGRKNALAGPGAISAVILAAHRSDKVLDYFMVSVGIAMLSFIVWLTLRVAPWLASHISATGINIFTRIMGLILAAIAIEYIANGLKGLFPLLAS